MSNLAVVLEAKGDLRIRENDRPEVPEGSLPSRYVRVAVKSTGICGSDVHYLKHGAIGEYIVKQPMILGHESSGIIVEVAQDCRERQVGDRVAIEPGVPCRHCTYCRSGSYNLCKEMRFAATPPIDGTLQKHYLVPEDFVKPVPDTMSFDEAALMEPLSVAVHIVKRLRLDFTSTCVVFGCGPIGLLTGAVMRAKGISRLLMIDANASRLDFAKRYLAALPGASSGEGGGKIFQVDTYLPKPPSSKDMSKIDYARENAAAIKAAIPWLSPTSSSSGGAHAVVDATGAEVCSQSAIFLTRSKGVFLQAGMGPNDIVLPISEICAREITVLGSFRYDEGCYDQSIALTTSGLVDVQQLVSHTFDFENAKEAFDTVAQGKEGVVKCIIRGLP